MGSFTGSVNNFWYYLWHLHVQTKKMFAFRFPTTFLSTSADSGPEKHEADFSEDVLPATSGGDSAGGGGNGGGDPGDYTHYSARQKIGLVAGPLLFFSQFF